MNDPRSTDVWPPLRCANPACGGLPEYPGWGLWRCRTCGLRHRPLDHSPCRRCDQPRHRHQYVVGVGEVCPVGVFMFTPVQALGQKYEVPMEVKQLLAEGREIWGDDKLTLEQIIVRIGVGVGDLCRIARGSEKDRDMDAELEKELGNLIFSTIRWCDDLGLDPEVCIRRAREAQQRFAAQNTRR